MENKEIRTVLDEQAEVRIANDINGHSRTISGYGIVFNSPSRLIEGRFYEIIKPEAIRGVIEKSDILALMNHDISRGVLARSTYGKGSMRLTVDSKGVKYSFEAPTFDLGNELVEGVKRGDIRGSSFAFSIAKDGESFDRQSDGTIIRTITKFEEIYDMSPCYKEAYEDTTVAIRNLDEFKDTNSEVETKPVVCEEPTGEPIVEVPIVRNVKYLELKQRNYIYKFNNK
jgi:hypothetical protein